MSAHHKGVSSSFQSEVVDRVVPPGASHCLRCGFHNLLGLTQEDLKGKVESIVVPLVNGIVAPFGWQYISVGVYGDYFEIYYKEASPAEPITVGTIITILTLITIIIINVVIVWVAWVYIETQKMKAQAKADKKQLLDEGKITNEQYTSMIEAQAEEDMFGALGDIIPLILFLLIIYVLAGAFKGRGKD